MVLYTGLDLAERHSAAVCVDDDGEPVWESVFDAGSDADPLVRAALLETWWTGLPRGGEWVVEQVFFRATNYGPALRLEGSLIMLMVQSGIQPRMITAITWQNQLGYIKKVHGDTKSWAESMCGILGYTPNQTGTVTTKVLKKQREDLRDAFLLARWLRFDSHQSGGQILDSL